MDTILSGLFGAKDNDDEQSRVNKANDFVSRVESGNKAEGYSTEEAVQNYASVTRNLSDDEFQGVAADALSQLTPEQRREFNHVIKQQAGVDLDDNVDDPQELASLTKQLRSQSGGDLGGLLGGLLGGGGGTGGGNDIMGALGGLLGGGGAGSIGTTGAQGSNQAGISGLLGNPIVKMVLGLIAAQGMKRFMGGDGQSQQAARVTPSAGSRADSGGGILDALFGGDDDNTPKERARQERGNESEGGGGLIDSLFGGDDKDETAKPNRGKKRVDVSDINRGERKKSL